MDSPTLNDARSALNLLTTRRSASVKAMGEPGPTEAQLLEILQIAVRVPDHGKLAPWRFLLFEGEARAAFGNRLAERWKALHLDPSAETLEFWRRFFMRAPVVLALISRAAQHPKIPEWEQILSAGAVGENILLAATALGLACQWNTDWPVYDEAIHRVLGLEAHERIAGFFYLGTSTQPLEDRPRPDPQSLLRRWKP